MPAVKIYIHRTCGFRARRLHTREGFGTFRTNTEPVFKCSKCNHEWNMLLAIPLSDVSLVAVNQKDVMVYEYGLVTTKRKLLA